MSNFRRCLREVLKFEGGYANHPKDPGGHTNKGVTLRTYRSTIKPTATVRDLKNIPDDEVAKIYKKFYWDPIDGDGLGAGVDYAVFDLAVNSGVARAKRMFKEVMHTHHIDNTFLIGKLCQNRMKFLRGLRHWTTFGRGWTRRVDHVQSLAVKWAREDAVLAKRNKEAPDSVPPSMDPPAKAWTLGDFLIELIKRIFA